jgi:hypothetical protein
VGISTSLKTGKGKYSLSSGFWCGNLREGNHLENPGIEGRIILK